MTCIGLCDKCFGGISEIKVAELFQAYSFQSTDFLLHCASFWSGHHLNSVQINQVRDSNLFKFYQGYWSETGD